MLISVKTKPILTYCSYYAYFRYKYIHTYMHLHSLLECTLMSKVNLHIFYLFVLLLSLPYKLIDFHGRITPSNFTRNYTKENVLTYVCMYTRKHKYCCYKNMYICMLLCRVMLKQNETVKLYIKAFRSWTKTNTKNNVSLEFQRGITLAKQSHLGLS